MDSYGIKTLENIPFGEATEEVSLMDNLIENPVEVAKYLIPLPNLKAVWLNRNPVVDTCANFNSIGEAMEKLEVLNRKFTSRAGEWALIYYGKPEKSKSLSEVRSLDVSGRGVLGI